MVENHREAWLVRFDDPDREDVTFSGSGAREAARVFFERSGVAWSCQLFEMVDQTPTPTANENGGERG